jgi:hypothetical protein
VASHHQPLRQQLIRSVAEECGGPKAVRFDPDARAYEAFNLGRDAKDRTSLYEPLSATVLNDALAEATSRWSWDRGDRIGIRELGPKIDRLHVYAVRRKSAANYAYRDYGQHREFARWLDHICTIDLNVVAGINHAAVGSEVGIHEHRQRQRPEGARR